MEDLVVQFSKHTSFNPLGSQEQVGYAIEPRFIPFLVASAVLTWQTVDCTVYILKPSSENGQNEAPMSIWARFHCLVKGIMEVQVLQDRSYAPFAYSMARLIGTFALVYLFVASARTGECIEWVNRAPFIFCPEDSLTITFVYCVLLAAASLSPNTRLMISPVNLYNAIVLAALGIYYYRDLWPLATYNLQPIDAVLVVESSLTLALLRCILTEGTVLYDGLDTSTINLDALRSNITIIPQVPELLSGTLRQNLDPFDQHDDDVLNDALRSSGLFLIQERSSENVRLNLETQIAGGGSNLSVGQSQIIALARAMVRKSKLLILDEATSAIDYNTDSLIQSTLRSKLGTDVTVIIVAHRLPTIMDADKIMVLDNGKIAEFDTPKTLLSNNTGMLHALVERSADKEMLYELAEKKSYVVSSTDN